MRNEKLGKNPPLAQESGKGIAPGGVSDVQPVDSGRTNTARKRPELSEDTRMTAGQFVASRRRQYGWSQEELSWRSGMSRTQIGRIERDESVPSLKSIEMLESALDTELYDQFMEQRRRQMKSAKERKKMRGPRGALGIFEKEIARKGLSEEDLNDLLSEALRSAEKRIKCNNSE